MTDHTTTDLAYPDAPVHILASINRYVEHGLRPGSFVMAVLSNDLAAAFQTADDESHRGLRDILRYIRWEIPGTCWGSQAKVEAWLEIPGSKPRQNPFHRKAEALEKMKQCRQQWQKYKLLSPTEEKSDD